MQHSLHFNHFLRCSHDYVPHVRTYMINVGLYLYNLTLDLLHHRCQSIKVLIHRYAYCTISLNLELLDLQNKVTKGLSTLEKHKQESADVGGEGEESAALKDILSSCWRDLERNTGLHQNAVGCVCVRVCVCVYVHVHVCVLSYSTVSHNLL